MDSLKISLLGEVRIDHEGLTNEFQLTRTVKALLGYLTLFRRRIHPREVLAGLFWVDFREDRARNSLRTFLILFYAFIDAYFKSVLLVNRIHKIYTIFRGRWLYCYKRLHVCLFSGLPIFSPARVNWPTVSVCPV